MNDDDDCVVMKVGERQRAFVVDANGGASNIKKKIVDL